MTDSPTTRTGANDDPLRVLVIDDDAMQLELVQRSLGRDGFEVETATNATSARSAIARFAPHFALVDVNIPGMSGDMLGELIRDGQSGAAATRFLLFSAWEGSKLRALANRLGAHGWVSKSTPLFDVGKTLRSLHAGGSEKA